MSSLVFPSLAGIEWPVKRTPMWGGSTIKQTSTSGIDYTMSQWTYPRWKWEVSFSYLPLADLQTLGGFFNLVYGDGDSWLFTDQSDCAVTGQTIGIGDGTTVKYQVVRTWGGFTEPVFFVTAAPTSVVYLNGTVDSPSNYTLTRSGGILTLNTAPGAGVTITMDFNYMWPCRFLSPSYDFDQFLYQVWANNQVDFISQKRYP